MCVYFFYKIVFKTLDIMCVYVCACVYVLIMSINPRLYVCVFFLTKYYSKL